MTISINSFIEQLLRKLTLRQKADLCQGQDCLMCGHIPEQGIGCFNMHDGPQGVRLEDGRKATAMPCGMSLSCTFDPKAAETYGAVIGRECNALNIHSILGPGFNLMRTPLNGRNFEYYGEDPVLSGKIAAGFIRGCQHQKVSATPKHFALNNQEICRTTGNSIIDERSLQELYLRNFEIAVREGHPWMMMSSYNQINGVDASACAHTQNAAAKQKWGFDGVMVSDWGGAHSTVGCALGGMDLEMGSKEFFGEPLYEAVRNGEVPESVLDDKVRRILRLFYRTGVIGPEKIPQGELNSRRNHEDCLHLAEQGMVLLKNKKQILPFNKKKLKTLAVIGPSADFQHHAGGLENCGGSGAVHPEYEITPLTGLQEYCGDDVKILHAPGVRFECEYLIPEDCFQNGLEVEYFSDSKHFPDSNDKPFATEKFSSPNHVWGQFLAAGVTDDDPLSHKMFAIRMTGRLTVQKSGRIRTSLNTSRFVARLYLDNQLAVQTKRGGFSDGEGFTIDVQAGQMIDFRLEGRRFSDEYSELRILWKDDSSEEFKQALEIARQADAVLFVGGNTHRYDREAIGWGDVPGADIPSLNLPDGQSELIRAIAEVNPNTVVALINGSVMNVEPWINQVAGLLECWYPGMEGGRALANILFGETEPGGRLCCSWARQLNDYACHANGSYPGVRNGDHPYVTYPEGIFIGYRHLEKEGIAPRFPFGFGLGYTTMDLKQDSVEILEKDLPERNIRVAVHGTVTNTGDRPGAAVVQLYVGDLQCSLPRPVKELKNFAKYQLTPGESAAVAFELTYRDFSFFSEERHDFTVESGDFAISLGLSSADLAGTEIITL